MQTTGNYQLNQWDASDRILRTDFNADNQKIDAAIQAIQDAGVVRKIKDIVTSAQAQQVDLDMTDIDLTQYTELEMKVELGANSISEFVYLLLRVNSVSDGGYMLNGGASYALGALPAAGGSDLTIVGIGFHVELGSRLVCNSYGGHVSASGFEDYWAGSKRTATTTLTPADVTALNFTMENGNYQVPAGTRIMIYGVRK